MIMEKGLRSIIMALILGGSVLGNAVYAQEVGEAAGGQAQAVADKTAPPAASVAATTEPTAAATPLAVTSPTPAPTTAPTPQTTGSYDAVSELMLFENVIKVASMEEEPLNEAPVIASVITAEEIKRMGARCLEDVLLTIPGYSHIQDMNDYYGCLHGIYGSNQNKILVLRDGHRLNSRDFLTADTDFAIGLENIKRIEILRGPGGSLYGDVALTGVINIVTKDKDDPDTIETTFGAGNFGQKKLSFLANQHLGKDEQLLLSGSYYESQGEFGRWPDPRNPMADGTSPINAFRDKPAYDLYMKYQLGGWRFIAGRSYNHYTSPRTDIGPTGFIYDLDKFVLRDAESPGVAIDDIPLEVQYDHAFKNWHWKTTLYADHWRIGGANLITDNLTGTLELAEWTYGGQTEATIKYDLGSLGKGSLLTGLKAEQMDLYHSIADMGSYPDFSFWLPLAKGKEQMYAAFAQTKHYLGDDWILNVGARFDYKQRKRDIEEKVANDLEELSPRAALIYKPTDTFSTRLSYSHSFDDAPYWYRYNFAAGIGYLGAKTLKPEKLNSYQFSIENKSFNGRLSQRLNVFYNNFIDVVFRDPSNFYTNAGLINSAGVEAELNYQQANLKIRSNYTYMKTVQTEGLAMKDNKIENVPAHMANLVLDFAPFYYSGLDRLKNLWLDVQARYVGEQFSIWGHGLPDPDKKVAAVGLINAGITIDDVLPNVDLAAHVYNVANQRYFQGGTTDYPYLQAGRWFLAKLTYKFGSCSNSGSEK